MPNSQNKQGEQSDTPRTDAYERTNSMHPYPDQVRHLLKFARQLERELPSPFDQTKLGEPSNAGTPRTDAACITWNCEVKLGINGETIQGRVVPADFARQLERELSLLSQQHAPPKQVEERIDELAAFFIDQYLPENFEAHSALCELLKAYRAELATELTKGREEEKKTIAFLVEQSNERLRSGDEARQLLADLGQSKP